MTTLHQGSNDATWDRMTGIATISFVGMWTNVTAYDYGLHMGTHQNMSNLGMQKQQQAIT